LRLLDLFAQRHRRLAQKGFLSGIFALHVPECAKICAAAVSLLSAWMRLDVF
jgi:hypothetical protein